MTRFGEKNNKKTVYKIKALSFVCVPPFLTYDFILLPMSTNADFPSYKMGHRIYIGPLAGIKDVVARDISIFTYLIFLFSRHQEAFASSGYVLHSS